MANTANILARSAAAHRKNTATGTAVADSSLSAEVIRTTGIGTHIGAGAILTRTTAIILRIGTLTTIALYQDNDSLGPNPWVVSRAGFSQQLCQRNPSG